MSKIIPIVIAVIILVGGGAYFLFYSGKINSPVLVVSQNSFVAPTGMPVDTETPVNPQRPVTIPTIDVAKNQITLKITQPTNNATVTNPNVVVRGITSPRADVAVNEKEVVAGVDGSFSVTLILDEGDNYISVVATDVDGNAAEAELNITLNTGN
jgi:hypothetical protein